MEHDESSDCEVYDDVGITRRSIGSFSDNDIVDGNACSGNFMNAASSTKPEMTVDSPGEIQILSKSTPASPISGLPSPGVSRDAEEYFMGHPERGVALIFSHENFDLRIYGDRCFQPATRFGTAIDRNSLCETFSKLGFKVLPFNDLYHYQISNKLRQVAKEDHHNRDCIAVAVLTHGDRGGMLDARDEEYHISELWEPFTATWCPSLAGKPKLFFIQACRGRDTDPGVMVSQQAVDGHDHNPDAELTYPVPSYADMFVSCSTFEGQYSYRNEVAGSWYVQTLCAELDLHATTKDLMSLITAVNRIVGQTFSSRNKNPQLHGMVEAPCFTSSLTRRLSLRQNSQQQRPSSSSDSHPP